MKTKEENSWANFFLENGFVEPINSSSTGICLLALAIERYIFVCKATSAQTLLSKKRHIILCSFSTCSILISFSAILIRMMSEHNCVSNSHEQLCFNLPNNIWISALLEIIFLFLVPASICVVLYYKVAKTLKARRRNDDVNRRLNIGFTVTCAAWILFWIPSEILHFVYISGAPIGSFPEFRHPQSFYSTQQHGISLEANVLHGKPSHSSSHLPSFPGPC